VVDTTNPDHRWHADRDVEIALKTAISDVERNTA
jgi:hypothetical protein